MSAHLKLRLVVAAYECAYHWSLLFSSNFYYVSSVHIVMIIFIIIISAVCTRVHWTLTANVCLLCVYIVDVLVCLATMNVNPFTRLPEKQALYDPQFESDACGVGFVVNIDGLRSQKVTGSVCVFVCVCVCARVCVRVCVGNRCYPVYSCCLTQFMHCSLKGCQLQKL